MESKACPEKSTKPEDRNDLAYWFPRLKASGVLVPRTEIITTELDLIGLCEGEPPEGFDVFIARLGAACDRMGYPAFLRTGHGSGKHGWEETCFIQGPSCLISHVAALVEWSATVDFLGLPTRTWAVREFLRLHATFVAFAGMPVAREFRCFIRDGELLCLHPYWPADSIQGPSHTDWRDRLDALNELSLKHEAELRRLVRAVARQFDGAWSVDFAMSVRGDWYAIDMAQMDRSFHWPGCPNAPAAPEEDPAFADFVASLRAAKEARP